MRRAMTILVAAAALSMAASAAAQPAASCCSSPGLSPQGQEPIFHKEPLVFEFVKLATRSYK